MKDQWTDRLSDYLDGELSAPERAELDRHLSSCTQCSATLERLRQVVARAQALEDRPPASDLWRGIAVRIGASESSGGVTDLEEHRQRRVIERRFSFSLPQLAAASVALMFLSGGAAWLATRSAGPAGEAVQPAPEVETAFVAATPAFTTTYDAAVTELEQVLEASRDQLDTTTVRIIEDNLAIIDRAIAQAQRALTQDPASIYLKEHLAATMRQKLEFLRQAAQMAGAVS
jgi:anti-sigma factor RsiW